MRGVIAKAIRKTAWNAYIGQCVTLDKLPNPDEARDNYKLFKQAFKSGFWVPDLAHMIELRREHKMAKAAVN